MIIRYKRNSPGEQTLPHAFEAYSDTEEPLGEASVEAVNCPLVWGARPRLVTIRAQGDESAMDALIGAATAHALILTREGGPACVRAELPPESASAKVRETLEILGFKGSSRLIRMRETVGPGPTVAPIPEGLTVVRDYLNDEGERRFYLERVNTIFGGGFTPEWLAAARQKPHFSRMLLIDKNGAAGEMVTWEEDGEAVAENIWVHPDWRRRGAGKFLLEFARIYWLECGAAKARMDVWSRIEPAVRLAYSAGFRPAETVKEYPFLDVR